MIRLWTWCGTWLGGREGDELWVADGRHVGHFADGEVYAADGCYLGEIMDDNWLVVDRAKQPNRQPRFAPLPSRAPLSPQDNLPGFTLLVGYDDFLAGLDSPAAPSVAPESVALVRQAFAEELRFTAGVRLSAVVGAFASVPRERFVGPGPWQVLSPTALSAYWTTKNADPRHVYHDALIAIDPDRRLNNGQPSLWAFLYDQLELAPGARVVHVGAGTGYYSAILAAIVGPSGTVTAIEVDPDLAERARANLSPWPQATVIAANGFDYRPDQPADAVIVNAGVSHLSLTWLDALAKQNGRLLVPLTTADCWGGFLLITRHGGATRYPARFVSRTGIILCVGGRDPHAEARLQAALSGSNFQAIRSLRWAPDVPDETSWLEGDGWWLSTEAVE